MFDRDETPDYNRSLSPQYIAVAENSLFKVSDCSNGDCPLPPSNQPKKNPLIAQEFLNKLKKIPDITDAMYQYAEIQPTTKIYKWSDLKSALEEMVNNGIGGNTFYVGDSVDIAFLNLATFLGQCMQETIQYNACDENNWSGPTGGRKPARFARGSLNPDRLEPVDYPLSAACGQLGQDYEEYTCPEECPRLPNAEFTAHTGSNYWGAPPKLACAPIGAKVELKFQNHQAPATKEKLMLYNDDNKLGWWFSGSDGVEAELHRDTAWNCSKDGNPDNGAICMLYPREKNEKGEEIESQRPRTDVAGCAWWGRGIIQTTGRCNYGKLNKAIGAESKNIKYGHLDFCNDPNLICNPSTDGSVKWIAGFFYWIDTVQGHNKDYEDSKGERFNFFELINSGNHTDFIIATSSLVNRGCALKSENGSCPISGKVDAMGYRIRNTNAMIKIFQSHGVMNHLYKDLANEIYSSKFKLQLNKCNNYVKLIHLSSRKEKVLHTSELTSYI
tara:strand:- start:538 stop:2037 length:1500 start_codon:yes stop_codon:yes gene_type:complete